MVRFTALLLTVLTGAAALVYEVAWQKYFATLLGSHSEATAAVLAIFLGGLAAGYALFGRVTQRLVGRERSQGRPARLLFVYGLVEAGIGVYALLFPTLFGIVVVVFLLMHLAPGSPASALGSAESGRRMSAAARTELRHLYGLDRPLPERFVQWLGRVARFDLGESFVDRRPVSERIREALPATLALNGLALFFTLAIA